jgi:DNA-binding response OmpR family regulator
VPRRVLVVEDEADLRFLWRTILEGAGFEVFEAVDGGNALTSARRETPDVILLDGHLPDISGWDVLDVLNADASLNSIPVLMVTGDTSDEARDRSGTVRYLTKPLTVEQLVSAVREALERGKP